MQFRHSSDLAPSTEKPKWQQLVRIQLLATTTLMSLYAATSAGIAAEMEIPYSGSLIVPTPVFRRRTCGADYSVPCHRGMLAARQVSVAPLDEENLLRLGGFSDVEIICDQSMVHQVEPKQIGPPVESE